MNVKQVLTQSYSQDEKDEDDNDIDDDDNDIDDDDNDVEDFIKMT